MRDARPHAEPAEQESATVSGIAGTPGDGPYVVLQLTVNGDRIQSTAVDSNGCPAAIECSRLAARLVANRTLAEASRLESSDLILLLKEFQGPKERYAVMTINALRTALGKLQ